MTVGKTIVGEQLLQLTEVKNVWSFIPMPSIRIQSLGREVTLPLQEMLPCDKI
jgi:hypothetical protein